jgi:hypothetical protein
MERQILSVTTRASLFGFIFHFAGYLFNFPLNDLRVYRVRIFNLQQNGLAHTSNGDLSAFYLYLFFIQSIMGDRIIRSIVCVRVT